MSNGTKTLITHISWGRCEVQTGTGAQRFKDCKVWPGGATEWDWSLTGTRHQPGIQPTDIQEILDQGVEVLVLSRGMELMLHTCPQTEQLLRSRGVEYYIEETRQAVELFNCLMERGIKVGGIFSRPAETGPDNGWSFGVDS
jgi:hypothetical protein